MMRYGMAVVAGLALGAVLANPMVDAIFPYQPYTNVIIERFERTSPETHRLLATFKKTECVFKDLVPYGREFGRWERIEWSDLGGEEGDRLKGWHTFNLEFDTGSHDWEIFELRTRHLCGTGDKEEFVDGVFYRTTDI